MGWGRLQGGATLEHGLGYWCCVAAVWGLRERCVRESPACAHLLMETLPGAASRSCTPPAGVTSAEPRKGLHACSGSRMPAEKRACRALHGAGAGQGECGAWCC